MAVKNRDEAVIEVNTIIVPTVTNTTHRGLLNNSIVNSIVFRKDVIASETPGGGAVVIDYIDKDTATVVTAVSLSVSFTNIENGDVKYLQITKSAANTIAFAGSTDVSIRKGFIDSAVTVVQYVVRNKNGVITVESINIDNDRKETKEIDIGDWNMDTTPGVTAAHGLSATQWKTIKITSIMVRNDADNTYYEIGFTNDTYAASGSAGLITSTVIGVNRLTGGIFDQATFNTTSYNRGTITFEYTA